MAINFEAFLYTLPFMVKGMIGIFAVTLMIIACVALLNKLNLGGDND